MRTQWAAVALLAITLMQPAYGMSFFSYFRDPTSTIGCTSGTCGVNAQCVTVTGGRPVCSCLSGYAGDPLVQCRKVECTDHSDCGPSLSCQNEKCVNPCAGSCGVNADCSVRSHVPVCSCPAHYTGNPFSSCRRMSPDEACHPSPCGQNTKCEVRNEVPICSCLPGYIGNALSGCRHECESDGECGPRRMCENYQCKDSCSACGQLAECNIQNHRAVCTCPQNYFGNPYSACRPECESHSDCPGNKPQCQYNKCVDPCIGACGHRANCEIRGIKAVCSCPKDMTGDPFVACRPFEKRDLCDPNPCGTNARCEPGYDNTNRERPVCTCLPGYFGNAIAGCQRGECQHDSECPQNRACVGYSCVDPCVGQCGSGAECNARQHIAVCTCPEGTKGDALISCNLKSGYTYARYFQY